MGAQKKLGLFETKFWDFLYRLRSLEGLSVPHFYNESFLKSKLLFSPYYPVGKCENYNYAGLYLWHVETKEPCITIQVDYETDLCINYT